MKAFLAGLCAIVALGVGATSLVYWKTRAGPASGELGSEPVAITPTPRQEPPATLPPSTLAQVPAPVPATALGFSPAAPPASARASGEDGGDRAPSPAATPQRPLHRGKRALDERAARLAVRARQPPPSGSAVMSR